MSRFSTRRGRPSRDLLQTLFTACRRPLRRGVSAAKADYYVKSYFSVGFALTLIGHFLLGVSSLRELTVVLHENRRLGRLTGLAEISKAQLPKLLHERPSELWAPLLAHLLKRVPAAEVPAAVRVLDTTFLTMGLRLFSRQHSDIKCTAHTAGYKAGVVWSHQQAAPVKLVCRAGQSNDAQYLSELLPQEETISEAIYLFDRGFRKYAFWDKLIQRGAGFITRAWRQLHFEVIETRLLDPAHPTIVSDQIGYAGGKRHRMTHPLRRIVLRDKGKETIFLTSDLEQPAWDIAELYRCRWQIEIFFRWLKRVLGCRKSLAMSLQATIHTLSAALATYLLLVIFARHELPHQDVDGLVGLKKALLILRHRLAETPGKSLRRCLGFYEALLAARPRPP